MIADMEAAAGLQHGDYGPSIQSFLDDGHFIRVLIGGRGSGKTAGLAHDVTDHCWQNAGAKVIIARQTEVSQSDSTIDTFNSYFETRGDLYRLAVLGLFKSWNDGRKFRLPSRLAVKTMERECKDMKSRAEIAKWIETRGDALCSYIHFRGLPDAEKGKFRGMECSYLALVEADQIIQKQFSLSLACLRWKGADPETCDEKGFITDRCVVLDTNPPAPSHWIAKLEEEEVKKPKKDRTMRFWHIATYENEHNLPENYIRDTILLPYANNPPMLQRMLYGRYADAFDGSPVFYAYQIHVHEARELPWPKGAYLWRGHDVGTNAASVWSAYWIEGKTEYWHDLFEYYMEGSDTDRHAREILKLTESEFPFWNDRGICAGVYDAIDPAAANSSYTREINVDGRTKKESPLTILNQYGIYPVFKTTARGLKETIALVNRLYEKRDEHGNPVYQIDAVGCPRMIRGLHGGYRWPPADQKGGNENVPLKGLACENLDHCFIAGTRVLTTRGSIPIETVRIGDHAITRRGARRVTATMSRTAEVREYTASDGTKITCTPDHPFWSETRQAMIPIEHATQCDTLIQCNHIQRLASSTGRFIADTLTHAVALTGSISRATRRIVTMPYGKSITDQGQRASISITRMKTQETTRSEIWNSSLRSSTLEYATAAQRDGSKPSEPLNSPSQQPRHGMDRKQAESGTQSTRDGWDSEPWFQPENNASDAGGTSFWNRPPELLPRPVFVPMRANRRTVAQAVWTTWTKFAAVAARHIGRTATQSRGRMDVRIVAQSKSGRSAEVFDLTIEGDHEFYANGILVGNCMDAARYAKINALTLLKAEIETANKPIPWNHRKPSANPKRRI